MYTPLLRIIQHQDNIFFKYRAIILGIILICYALWIFCQQFYSIFIFDRAIAVRKFRQLALDTFVFSSIQDALAERESPYKPQDLDKNMWSLRKMIYLFWVKEYRRMFYDPKMYDYLAPYFEFIKSDGGQKLMDRIYKYWLQGDIG